ncbi:hypothetical protein MASR2M15_17780 [Anaerolineales bacterium]
MLKKVAVADRLALYVNPIYTDPAAYRGLSLILATVFFAFQIYCDFSAYSDIAIGVARIIGVRLSRNFNAPYLAISIPDFWQRWHITLSTWFRDYLYIPLGGNRVAGWRWQMNIMIVFVVSGLWHGAEWTFVIWGFVHGLMYLVNSYGLAHQALHLPLPVSIRKLLQIAAVFIVVCFAWIFCRANWLEDAVIVLRNMVDFSGDWPHSWSAINVAARQLDIILGSLGIMIVMMVDIFIEAGLMKPLLRPQFAALRFAAYIALLFALTLFGAFSASQQFVYFQF